MVGDSHGVTHRASSAAAISSTDPGGGAPRGSLADARGGGHDDRVRRCRRRCRCRRWRRCPQRRARGRGRRPPPRSARVSAPTRRPWGTGTEKAKNAGSFRHKRRSTAAHDGGLAKRNRTRRLQGRPWRRSPPRRCRPTPPPRRSCRTGAAIPRPSAARLCRVGTSAASVRPHPVGRASGASVGRGCSAGATSMTHHCPPAVRQ